MSDHEYDDDGQPVEDGSPWERNRPYVDQPTAQQPKVDQAGWYLGNPDDRPLALEEVQVAKAKPDIRHWSELPPGYVVQSGSTPPLPEYHDLTVAQPAIGDIPIPEDLFEPEPAEREQEPFSDSGPSTEVCPLEEEVIDMVAEKKTGRTEHKLTFDPVLTEHANAILNGPLQDTIELFVRKSNAYGEPDMSDDLGIRGQYADLHRKWKLLRKHMWDGQPWTHTEPFEEVLMDFVGHLLKTMQWTRENR